MNLKCPHCGYDGSSPPWHREDDEPFLYLEDIVCYRRVLLEGRQGVLNIHGLYHTGEGFDDGENARLMCGDCLEEFPIPPGLEIDFV
jgi:hypothetical protein